VIVCASQVKVAKSDPEVYGPFDAQPIINIQSPLNNEIFFSSNVTLAFSVATPENWIPNVNEVLSAKIILDNEILPTSYTLPTYTSLTTLKDGKHTLQLSLVCQGANGPLFPTPDLSYFNYTVLSNTVSFIVDSVQPKVAILSIENQAAQPVKNESYSMATVALNFNLNKPMSKITYSLDGQANVTIVGNTTLTNLPYGEHNVTVYAN
jgi:hypothetical protein